MVLSTDKAKRGCFVKGVGMQFPLKELLLFVLLASLCVSVGLWIAMRLDAQLDEYSDEESKREE